MSFYLVRIKEPVLVSRMVPSPRAACAPLNTDASRARAPCFEYHCCKTLLPWVNLMPNELIAHTTSRTCPFCSHSVSSCHLKGETPRSSSSMMARLWVKTEVPFFRVDAYIAPRVGRAVNRSRCAKVAIFLSGFLDRIKKASYSSR